jgi:hypothetical protein
MFARKPRTKRARGRLAPSSDSESDADDTRGKTRTGGSGVQNYNKVDKGMLFATVEEILPTGEKGWKLVEGVYNVKAILMGRPDQAALSLKNKYQLVRCCDHLSTYLLTLYIVYQAEEAHWRGRMSSRGQAGT